MTGVYRINILVLTVHDRSITLYLLLLVFPSETVGVLINLNINTNVLRKSKMGFHNNAGSDSNLIETQINR